MEMITDNPYRKPIAPIVAHLVDQPPTNLLTFNNTQLGDAMPTREEVRLIASARTKKTQLKRQKKAQSSVTNDNLEDFGSSDDNANCESVQESWQPETLAFLEKVKKAYVGQVGRNGDGLLPVFARGTTMSPSADPINFLRLLEGNDFDEDSLQKWHFALPDIIIWDPTYRWPSFYEESNGRPKCPYHSGSHSCVMRHGFTHHFRRCYMSDGNAALICRRYICTLNKDKYAESQNDSDSESYCFQETDAAVLAQAPPFVQAYWRQHGVYLSHRSAMAWTEVDKMISLMSNGLSSNGYANSLQESYVQRHALHSKMWIDHIHRSFKRPMIRGGQKQPLELYFDFDEPNSEIRVPSASWLVTAIGEEMENRSECHQRAMQRISGRYLSGDHSHKVAKVILMQGTRAFEGMYTVMNEYSQILGFWFVNGTSLSEIEPCLQGLNARYKLHGFEGPIFFTTDRCCDERSFFEGAASNEKCPIFDSFCGLASHDGEVDTHSITINQVRLPKPAVYIENTDVANVTASQIINTCNGVVSYDSEWCIGRGNQKPQTIQIGLANGNTYIFKVGSFRTFPCNLRQLLESENIKKVGCCLGSDSSRLRNLDPPIALNGRMELARLAKNRGLIGRAQCSLSDLVMILFHCEVEKTSELRLSDWSQSLSEQQITYAAIDAYASMQCYLKLMAMPYVDPSEVPKPRLDDLREGTKILLYPPNNRLEVVATGTVTGRHCFERSRLPGMIVSSTSSIMVEVRKGDIKQPSVIVPCFDNCQSRRSFHDILQDDSGAECDIIQLPWKISQVRIMPENVLTQVEIAYEQLTVEVPDLEEPADSVDPCPIEHENLESTGNAPVDESRASIGDSKGIYTRVKQDILHIFLRFQHVLSRNHGVYRIFMSRLSDAFFVVSHEDVKLIKECLRRHGFSEEQIKSKPWQFFKTRVRRTVPKPSALANAFKRVVDLFANVEDSKTKKPLFGKMAWNLYKTTLRHIEMGCLSDRPGVSYYFQIGEDSLGIPMYCCTRGTSALEGFHQKVRCFIRGFNISPRFAILLMREYCHRWNRDIAVRHGRLPTMYTKRYDDWNIDEEIEITSQWSECKIVAHPFWDSSKNYVCTGEKFGLVSDSSVMSHSAIDDETNEHEEGDTLENETPNEVDCAFAMLPSSATWVAAQIGWTRPLGPVASEAEYDFFARHYATFLNNGNQGNSSADQYTALDFGKFCHFWNSQVNEALSSPEGHPNAALVYKNEFHLSAYWKELKRKSRCIATAVDIRNSDKNLREELRGTDRQLESSFEPAPQVQMIPARRVENGNPVRIQAFAGALPAGRQAEDYRPSMPLDQNGAGSVQLEKARKRAIKRCQLCGHQYHRDSHYRDRHSFGPNAQVVECRVADTEREPGYPKKSRR